MLDLVIREHNPEALINVVGHVFSDKVRVGISRLMGASVDTVVEVGGGPGLVGSGNRDSIVTKNSQEGAGRVGQVLNGGGKVGATANRSDELIPGCSRREAV